MPLFQPDNAELLVTVSRLSLQGLDRLLSYVPPSDQLPSDELGALTRLISSALNRGMAASQSSNGPPS